MDIPKSLRVGTPLPFGHLVHRPFSTDPVPDIERLEGKWLEISGGPLPLPIAVRVDRADEGRFMVTGLLIGLRSRREITWETLRKIKPSSILGYIFAGFDPRNPVKHVAEHDLKYVTTMSGDEFDEQAWARGEDDDDDLPLTTLSSESWREEQRVNAAFDLWESAGQDERSSRPVEAVTRPRASVATNLTEFAEAYLRHLAAAPHRATTATANELHISRATAIRRIAEARELGLIPPKGTKS